MAGSFYRNTGDEAKSLCFIPSSRPSGGGGVLGLMFAGYVPLASQSPYPIVVYFWANYRAHLSHVLEM